MNCLFCTVGKYESVVESGKLQFYKLKGKLIFIPGDKVYFTESSQRHLAPEISQRSVETQT